MYITTVLFTIVVVIFGDGFAGGPAGGRTTGERTHWWAEQLADGPAEGRPGRRAGKRADGLQRTAVRCSPASDCIGLHCRPMQSDVYYNSSMNKFTLLRCLTHHVRNVLSCPWKVVLLYDITFHLYKRIFWSIGNGPFLPSLNKVTTIIVNQSVIIYIGVHRIAFWCCSMNSDVVRWCS